MSLAQSFELIYSCVIHWISISKCVDTLPEGKTTKYLIICTYFKATKELLN